MKTIYNLDTDGQALLYLLIHRIINWITDIYHHNIYEITPNIIGIFCLILDCRLR